MLHWIHDHEIERAIIQNKTLFWGRGVLFYILSIWGYSLPNFFFNLFQIVGQIYVDLIRNLQQVNIRCGNSFIQGHLYCLRAGRI